MPERGRKVEADGSAGMSSKIETGGRRTVAENPRRVLNSDYSSPRRREREKRKVADRRQRRIAKETIGLSVLPLRFADSV